MPYHEQILRLVDAIYDAALHPVAWPRVLELLCEQVDGHSACLLYHNADVPRGTVMASVRMDPSGAAEYDRYYGALDPWARALASRGQLKTGLVCTGESLIPSTALRRTEFYNDYGRRYGVVRNAFALQFDQHAPTGFVITVLRPDRAAPFDRAATDLLTDLVPHLQRAIAIHEMLPEGRVRDSAAFETLDLLDTAIVALDGRGGVVFANRAARALVDAGDGLSIAKRTLVATSRHTAPTLAAAIANALGSNRQTGAPEGATLTIERPSGRRPLTATVAPLPARFHAAPRPFAAAVVVIADPERRPQTPAAVLQRLYRLTPAEAALASALADGQSLSEAAARLEIKASTARTHLKRILQKTDTSRQAQLVRLLIASGTGLAD